MFEKQLIANRFIEDNVICKKDVYIEPCSVCLQMFFCFEHFEDIESKSFIGGLLVEPVLSCPQLTSSRGINIFSRRSPKPQRPTGPGNCLRRNAAPHGGAHRQSRGCRALALERGRGGRRELRWPGASKAGPEIGSPTWGISEGFKGLKF